MIKGVVLQGTGRWGPRGAPRLEKASLNQEERRRKVRLKK